MENQSAAESNTSLGESTALFMCECASVLSLENVQYDPRLTVSNDVSAAHQTGWVGNIRQCVACVCVILIQLLRGKSSYISLQLDNPHTCAHTHAVARWIKRLPTIVLQSSHNSALMLLKCNTVKMADCNSDIMKPQIKKLKSSGWA